MNMINIYEVANTMKGLYVSQEITKFLKDSPVFNGVLMAVLFYWICRWAISFRKMKSVSIDNVKDTPLMIVWIITCLIVCKTVFAPTSVVKVTDFSGYQWGDSKGVREQVSSFTTSPGDGFRVSTLMYIFIKLGSGLDKYLSQWVDNTFNSKSSYLKNPDGFYKAHYAAASMSIKDRELKSQLNYYFNNCVTPLYKIVKNEELAKSLDSKRTLLKTVFSEKPTAQITRVLKNLALDDGRSCYEVGIDFNRKLIAYYKKNSSFKDNNSHISTNRVISSYLNNSLDFTHNEVWWIEESAETSGLASAVQRFEEFFSFKTIGEGGAGMAADAAVKFNQLRKHMPAVKSYILFVLFTIFPFLVYYSMYKLTLRPFLIWCYSFSIVMLWNSFMSLMYWYRVSGIVDNQFLSNMSILNDGVSIAAAQSIAEQVHYDWYAFYGTQMAIIAASAMGLLGVWKTAGMSMVMKESTPAKVKAGIQKAGKWIATKAVL